MIAVITSKSIIENTEYLSKGYLLNKEQRIYQTLETIQSLKQAGFEQIYIFDNSGSKYSDFLKEQYLDANVFIQDQFSFKNRGLSEIHLLLNNLGHLPEGSMICKISGRYKISNIDGFLENWEYLQDFQILARKDLNSVSTRLYMVQSKEIWRKILVQKMNRMYYKQFGISGPRSLYNSVSRCLNPPKTIEDPFLSIESAFYDVLKFSTYKVKFLAKLHLTGTLGLDSKTLINE